MDCHACMENPTDFIYGDSYTYQIAGKTEVINSFKLLSSCSISVQYIVPVQQLLKILISFCGKKMLFSGLLFPPHIISKKHLYCNINHEPKVNKSFLVASLDFTTKLLKK